MHNIRHKDIYYDHDKNLKRRKKIIWTIILLFFFLVFEYITIFNGTRFRPYSVLAMLAAWAITILISCIWINFEKQIESTGITRLQYLLINCVKLSIVIVPVVYLTVKCVDYTQEYQLAKHGVLSKGVITNVTIIENESDTTYHADFIFSTATKDYAGFSVINKNEYETGDSVFVLYSSKDLNLTKLKGKINRLN